MLFKKYINVYYDLDKMGSYEDAPDKNEESKEISKETQESLGKLLENIGPMNEDLEKIYKLFDNLLNAETFSKDEIRKNLLELKYEHKEKLGPEYINNKESEEAIKIYDVIFLDPSLSTEEAVNTISNCFDDENIPMSIKLKLAKLLKGSYMSNMVYDPASFDNIDKNSLDKDLTNIYENLKKYEGKNLSIDDYNKLISYQETLYSPNYRNDENAKKIQYIVSNIMDSGSAPYFKDRLKGVEISNELITKYPTYDWELAF